MLCKAGLLASKNAILCPTLLLLCVRREQLLLLCDTPGLTTVAGVVLPFAMNLVQGLTKGVGPGTRPTTINFIMPINLINLITFITFIAFFVFSTVISLGLIVKPIEIIKTIETISVVGS